MARAMVSRSPVSTPFRTVSATLREDQSPGQYRPGIGIRAASGTDCLRGENPEADFPSIDDLPPSVWDWFAQRRPVSR
jgi:hypothetical protein